MINIGQSIHDELVRQERSISWLARKLNCNRAVIYRILQKNSIDTLMLQRISQILNHDFFRDLSAEIVTPRGTESQPDCAQNDTVLYQ